MLYSSTFAWSVKMAFLILLILLFKEISLHAASPEKDSCHELVVNKTAGARESVVVNLNQTLTLNSSDGIRKLCTNGSNCTTVKIGIVKSKEAQPTQFSFFGNVEIYGKLELVGKRSVSIESCIGNIVINSTQDTEVYCTGNDNSRKSCRGTKNCTGCPTGSWVGGGGGGAGGGGIKCKVNHTKCLAGSAHKNPGNISVLLGGNPECYQQETVWAAGGGAIELKAWRGKIAIGSILDASGESKFPCTGGGGGTIRLLANQIEISGNGKLIADGGNGSGCLYDGGGGGGIIHIIANSSLHLHDNVTSVRGGTGKCSGSTGVTIIRDPTDDNCSSFTVSNAQELTINSSDGTIMVRENESICSVEEVGKVDKNKSLPTQFISCGDVKIYGVVKLVGERTVSIQSSRGNIVINSTNDLEVYCTNNVGDRTSCHGTKNCTDCISEHGGQGGGGGGDGGVCSNGNDSCQAGSSRCPAANAHTSRNNTSVLSGGNPGCFGNGVDAVGGGAIELKALSGKIVIESVIKASGESVFSCSRCSGGGGTIRLLANEIQIRGNGKLIADGGSGPWCLCSCGGGGIIHIIANSYLRVEVSVISVRGGTGLCPGRDGLFLTSNKTGDNSHTFPDKSVRPDLASLSKPSTTLVYTTTKLRPTSTVKASLGRSFTTPVYTTTEQHPSSFVKATLIRSSTSLVHTTTEYATSTVKNLASLRKSSTTPLIYTTTDWELYPTSTVKDFANLSKSSTTHLVYTTMEQHPTSTVKATLIRSSTGLVHTTTELRPTSTVKNLASLSKSSTTPVYTTTKLHPTNTVKATWIRSSTSPVYTTTELHSTANFGGSSTTPIYTTTELHSTSSVKVFDLVSLNRSTMTPSAYRTTGPSSTSIVNIQDVNNAVKLIQNLIKLWNNTESCNKMPENCNTFDFEIAARVTNSVLNNSAFRPEPLLLPFSDFGTVFLHKGLYRRMEKTLSNLHYRLFVFNGSRDNPEAAIKDTVEISLDNITNHDNCKPNCIVKVCLGNMKRKELNITVGGKEYLLGSSIILVEMVVNGKHVTDLETQQAIVKIPLVTKEINNDVKCMYLDAETKKWSSKGVTYINTTKMIAKCKTNHLSNFAVFFAAEEPTSDGHRFALELISYIGCGLTLLAVVVTLVIYLIFRKDAPVFSVDRNIVHVHLMVSLALVQIFFLVTLGVRTSPVGCKIVAVLLHYLFMASFCWMLLEGILLYLKTVMGFGGENVDLKKFYVFGWVFPAVISALLVAVVVPLDKIDDVYGKGCFLSPKAHTIWVLLMPPAFCIAINLLVIVAVLRVILTLSDDDIRKRKAKTAFRGLVILSPLLGFTWAFALAAHLHDAVFWQYAFCLSNSFQGFFIFLIHGVGNSEIQKVVKRKIYPLQWAASAPSRSNQGSSCETFVEVATPSKDE